MMKRCFLLSILILIMSLRSHASQITISGDVFGEWTSDTVLVVGDIRIPPDSHLTIQAGTDVLFDGAYRLTLELDAKIVAVGQQANPITFKPRHAVGAWRGIRMNLCCGLSVLDYCRFERAAVEGTGDTASGGALYLNNSNLAIYHCTFENCSANSGGAISCENRSNPFITDCVFFANSAVRGGAIFCGDSSRPLIMSCQFAGNRGSAFIGGGAMHVERASPIIKDNMFGWNNGGDGCIRIWDPDTTVFIENNSFMYDSSTSVVHISDMGPWSAEIRNNTFSDNAEVAIFAEVASPRIEGNTIKRNGAGISLTYSSSHIVCNEIRENRGKGIGFYNDPMLPSTLVIDHNVIDRNLSDGISGSGCDIVISGNYVTRNLMGVGLQSCNAVIEHSTIADNFSNGPAGGIGIHGGSAVIRHCIIAQNVPDSAQIFYGGTNDVKLDSCIVPGLWQGIGNVDIDPLFRDTVHGDFHAMSNVVTTNALPSCGNGVPESMEIWIDPPQTSVDDRESRTVPHDFALAQNYPNPFNPATVISFSLPARTQVRLEVFNSLGQLVRVLCDKEFPSGESRVEWDGRDSYDRVAASGIYLYRLTTGRASLTRKMILLK